MAVTEADASYGHGDVWSRAAKRASSNRTICGAAVGLLALIVLAAGAHQTNGSLRVFGTAGPTIAAAVHNETLGFGAIILMSLPERTDRRDALTLIGSTTGVRISKYIAATKGEEIAPKARPFGTAHIGNAYLGSWRTHMDAMRYVVDNNLETALLLEDDADWDMRIKSQLAAFSAGLRDSRLRNHSTTPIDAAHPYGDDWDAMHLGAMFIKQAPEPYDGIYSHYPDPDGPLDPSCSDMKEPTSGEAVFCYGPLLEQLQIPRGDRLLLPSHSSIGLAALAVTLEGARRILFELSYNRLDHTLDWSIQDLTRRGLLRGWTIVPPLFGQYKVGDKADSDLSRLGKSEGPKLSQLDGISYGLERSARKALNDTFFGPDLRPNRWTTEYWRGIGVDVAGPGI